MTAVLGQSPFYMFIVTITTKCKRTRVEIYFLYDQFIGARELLDQILSLTNSNSSTNKHKDQRRNGIYKYRSFTNFTVLQLESAINP